MTQQNGDSDSERSAQPEPVPPVEQVKKSPAADESLLARSEAGGPPVGRLGQAGATGDQHSPRTVRLKTEGASESHILLRALASIALAGGAVAVNFSTNQKDLRQSALAFVVAAALTFWGTLMPGLRRKIALRMTAVVAVVLGLTFATGTYFLTQRPLYSDDFKRDSRSWPVQSDPTGDSQYSANGYKLTPKPGYAVWRAAPTSSRPANVIVSARARLNGAGGWGVWCRGTSDDQRYEFSLTHARVVYIKMPGEDAELHHADVDPSRFTTIEAQCEDSADEMVRLTMWVNGVKVAERYDNIPPVLGPGSSGIHAFAFGDLRSEPTEVIFEHFEIRNGANE